MQRKLIAPDMAKIPHTFHSLFKDAQVYDSSSSQEAQVLFIHKDKGYFLKSAPKNSLKREAEMTAFFHKKGMATRMAAYITDEKDWMLTEKVAGEDCIAAMYLDHPEKLCDTLAEIMSELHSLPACDCPVCHTEEYLARARENHLKSMADMRVLLGKNTVSSAEEAWKIVENNAHLLKSDTLIHGDFCLPNIMLDNWRFNGFIDLGNSGKGGRHVDIFWVLWSLMFNLKAEKYCSRFIDAYGRDKIDMDLLRLIAAIEIFG